MEFLIEMKYWFLQEKEVFDAAFAPPPPHRAISPDSPFNWEAMGI